MEISKKQYWKIQVALTDAYCKLSGDTTVNLTHVLLEIKPLITNHKCKLIIR